MRLSITRVLAVTAFALVAPSVGLALPSLSQQKAIRSNCHADFAKYCSGVSTKSIASLHCLQNNAAKLSPACGKAVAGK